ncbi:MULTISPECIES: diacylglycerol kinase family protein [Erysipelothrix]|uniref:Diacylglycerol kinase family protein n=2 Tax=Erysipelothrix piscisicarius TaxID=2485784 RepID=A0A3S8RMP5_9FIRM|nr:MULTISPECIES: diacylglycerol kinase family protein [Erysipelothrix]AZK44242.1 diacylglycerol kinase family protein [Erysipelothrix piscisicarius]MBK2402350.1 diacylglycerol kinase family protein [Erysipelothrix sp. strain 2 (EsS2-6-Brazil)]MBK2404408.1 diacylglycerol kinase family protein [Erysipelothrix sp. strain 2 (EsS2-7-Brazil)]NBA00555.1 diacylglycerol kinase family protein [Erysipelothrix rhusiopathiae]
MISLAKILKRTRKKFKSAFQGVKTGVLYDHSILIQLILGFIAIIVFALIGITPVEWMFVVSAVFMVLVTEFLNSAVEDICDLLIKNYNLHVKEIKDIAAGAVLLAAIYAIIIGVIVLTRRFI